MDDPIISSVCCSANEVDHHQMQHHVGKEKVGKCSLWRDVEKLRAVLRVGLHTETHWEEKIDVANAMQKLKSAYLLERRSPRKR